jgi:hypothetical protein
MLHRKHFIILALLLFASSAIAKDKKKVLLPVDVLQARTVLVVVDPDAGVDVQNPNANRLARTDVEQAMMKWGRLMPVQDGYTADLIVVVRKGNGKLAQSTIGGTPVNGTPPVNVGSSTTPNESTTHAAVRWGQSGVPNDPSNAGTMPSTPYPQTEVGSTQDTFAVYRGGNVDPNSSPLDAPAVWRYIAKGALDSPSVPAVEAFRKAIAESEKQLASNP